MTTGNFPQTTPGLRMPTSVLAGYGMAVAGLYAYFVASGIDPISHYGDAQTYWDLAKTWSATGMYQESWPESDPFKAWRPPGLPLLLRPLIALGQSPSSFIALNLVFLLIAAICSYKVCDELGMGSVPAAMSGFALVAFFANKEIIFYVMTETATVAFTLFALWLIARQMARSRRRIDRREILVHLAIGTCCGFAVLTRTTTLALFAPIFFALAHSLWCKNSTDAKLWLATIATAASLIGTWTIRNFLILDHFVLVNTAGAMNALFGSFSELDWRGLHEDIVHPLREQYGEVGSAEKMSSLLVQRVLEEPLRYLALKAAIVGDLVRPYSGWSLVWIPFAVVYAWANRKNPRVWMVTIWFLASLALTSIAFYRERFMFPLFPYMAIAGIGGITVLVASLRRFTRQLWFVGLGRR